MNVGRLKQIMRDIPNDFEVEVYDYESGEWIGEVEERGDIRFIRVVHPQAQEE